MARLDLAPGTVVPPLGVVSTDELRGLYWAVTTFAFPKTAEGIILPREWALRSSLFQELPADLDPVLITKLADRRAEFDPEPTLEKCVAEVVYERVRQRVLPTAPSRLRCLFAALDAYAAVQFSQTHLPPPVFDQRIGMSAGGATPVSTANGKWVALDMSLFAILVELGPDIEANAAAIKSFEGLAERYWRGERSRSLFVEILAEKLWQWTPFITEGGVPPPYEEWHCRSS